MKCGMKITVNDLINDILGVLGGGGRLIDMRCLLERGVYFNLTKTLTSLWAWDNFNMHYWM